MAVAEFRPRVANLHIAGVFPHLEFIQLTVVDELTEHGLQKEKAGNHCAEQQQGILEAAYYSFGLRFCGS